MDLAYLINNYRPTEEADRPRKTAALHYAYSIINPEMGFEEFQQRISPEVRGMVFGGNSDDAYFTALLATLSFHNPETDVFLAAVLNKAVIQLSFQTRFLTRGIPPDVYVQCGQVPVFVAAMANGSVVGGLLIGEREVPAPMWEEKYPHVEFGDGTLLARVDADVPAALVGMGRQIGCVAFLNRDNRIKSFHEEYRYLAERINTFTTFVYSDTPANIAFIEREITALYPQAVTLSRAYHETKAVLTVNAVAEIPAVVVGGRPCSFVRTEGQNDSAFVITIYRPTDVVVPAAPKYILSTSPVTEENRRKMESPIGMYHEFTAIKEGILIPSQDQDHSTYLHMDRDGRIALDCGNEVRAAEWSTAYRRGQDVDGLRTSRIEFAGPMQIAGSAMPLCFAPDVHSYFSHFMIQCLPRIQILRDLKIDAKILVPHDLRRKQRAMLHLLGIADERIVAIPNGMAVQCDELIVPRAWPLIFSPYTIGVYQEMLERVMPVQRDPHRRTLISRDSQRKWRNLVNYDAVRFYLTENYGFMEVKPELLTLEQEIRLFNETRILIGAEGAGLYGACFAQAGSDVVSLCDEDYIMPILATLCTSSRGSGDGFNLSHVFGESFRSRQDIDRRLEFGHADWSIDPILVGKMIEQILDN